MAAQTRDIALDLGTLAGKLQGAAALLREQNHRLLEAGAYDDETSYAIDVIEGVIDQASTDLFEYEQALITGGRN